MASAAPLSQPMLAPSGTLPTRGDWAYEVKWDG
jgi:ATP-dependent DNA ligase